MDCFGRPKQGNGPSGLKNHGENCYMNSMIQALASSPKLMDSYKEKTNKKPNCDKLNTLFDLLKDINKPENVNESVQQNTKRLKRLMQDIKWDRPSQQDTFQMLSFLINKIETDMKTETEKDIMPPKFKILHSFSDNASYNKIQDHLAITVPLCGEFRKKPGVKLEALLDAFFEPSVIDDGPHTTSMHLFGEAPRILLLHIQANEWSQAEGGYIKPKYYIKYDKKLKYIFTVHYEKNGSKSSQRKVTYRLLAVVHHMGGVDGGHYITYRRHNKGWYLTNDEQVEKKTFEYNIVPYIMLYEKVKEKVKAKVKEKVK